ncbi:MAG TPA: hypothetical protein IGS53_20590 [Leptolyngbyaceae cyanobacterium M33_DOE_097]|uniref:Peptidase n=1 Tax=Oscillatoriales cyanobacterium SpSt-418 TaxID=2282169 RepID=A0A7C3PC67_9CYAN|nr:hypothetical protein [Leptolyngbyaceae cyanobacterium M33_DOE_097]
MKLGFKPRSFVWLPVLAFALAPALMGAIAPSELAAPDHATVIAQKANVRRVKFKPGTSSATLENSVIRGERDVYLLGASKGQTMQLKISSLESNAVFDLASVDPKTKARRLLKQEAINWSGKLPQTGDYQVIVSGKRGNATYRLNVAIR